MKPVDVEQHSEPLEHGNRRAKPGYVWMCGACGKTSRDRYGFDRISHGWDESCMLHAVLVEDGAP